MRRGRGTLRSTRLTRPLRAFRRLILGLVVLGLGCAWFLPAAAGAQTLTNLYWISGDNIARANGAGTGVQTEFIPFRDVPSGLAVGQTSGDPYIYWSEALGDIARANLDGTGVIDPLLGPGSTDSDHITGIATDDQYIYWAASDDGACPQGFGIGRAELDGSDATPSWLCLTARPTGGLAFSNNAIFWTQTGGIAEAQVDDQGDSGVPEILVPTPSTPFAPAGCITGTTPGSLAIEGSSVFWGTPNPCAAIGQASVNGGEISPYFLVGGFNTFAAPETYIAADRKSLYWFNAQPGDSNSYELGRADLDGLNANPGFITDLSHAGPIAVGPGTDAITTSSPPTSSTGAGSGPSLPTGEIGSGASGGDGTIDNPRRPVYSTQLRVN